MPEFVRIYNREGSDIVEANISETSNLGVKVIERNMSCVKKDKIIHNSDIIASTIIEFICNDLKFEDKQNETEYLLLNSVLKEQKKIQEKKAKQALKNKGKSPKEDSKIKQKGRKSKFASKYQDRVESIQNADAKIAENRKIANEIARKEKLDMEAKRKAMNNNMKELNKKKKKRK